VTGAAAGGVTVRGVDHLQATLNAAAAELGDLAGAHAEAARILAAGAAARAPKRTGALAASIRVQTGRPVQVSTALVYAGVQEFGWPARRIRARRFIRDAVPGTRDQWLPVYERAVAAALDKVQGS